MSFQSCVAPPSFNTHLGMPHDELAQRAMRQAQDVSQEGRPRLQSVLHPELHHHGGASEHLRNISDQSDANTTARRSPLACRWPNLETFEGSVQLSDAPSLSLPAPRHTASKSPSAGEMCAQTCIPRCEETWLSPWSAPHCCKVQHCPLFSDHRRQWRWPGVRTTM